MNISAWPSHLERIASRLLHRSLGFVLPAVLACGDSTGPVPLVVPPSVFVSDADGVLGVYRVEDEAIVRLSAPDQDDRDPHSAAGRIVFTSRRDGNPEIYIADLGLMNQTRLTTTTAQDFRPALSPNGTTVAFVSSRSGAPRVWLMDADGANPRALATGSATFVPEGSPAWSPAGDRIAFTSTRTNTSQVFVVAIGGGPAEQVSHESNGGFAPSWSADGRVIHYMSLTGGSRIMSTPATGGTATPFVEDEQGVSEVNCAAAVCLATIGPLDGSGDILAMSRDGRSRRTIVARTANDRQPAILVPR